MPSHGLAMPCYCSRQNENGIFFVSVHREAINRRRRRRRTFWPVGNVHSIRSFSKFVQTLTSSSLVLAPSTESVEGWWDGESSMCHLHSFDCEPQWMSIILRFGSVEDYEKNCIFGKTSNGCDVFTCWCDAYTAASTNFSVTSMWIDTVDGLQWPTHN